MSRNPKTLMWPSWDIVSCFSHSLLSLTSCSASPSVPFKLSTRAKFKSSLRKLTSYENLMSKPSVCNRGSMPPCSQYGLGITWGV